MPFPAAVAAAPAAPGLLSWFASPTGIGLSTLLGLGTTGYFMAGGGQPSEEEQERMLRRQLEIQDEFERKRAGGEMGDLAGLVGGGGMSLEDLMAEELLTRKAARAGRALERFEEARPKYMDELDKILAGQTARIASLQSERTLTPLEIISMVEGGFG